MPARGTRGQLRIQRQQGVLQRVRAIAGAGMHHQAGRLVDDEEVRIAHTRPSARWLPACTSVLGQRLGAHHHGLAAVNRIARAAPRAVDRHGARFIQAASREREYCGNAAARAWSRRWPSGAFREDQLMHVKFRCLALPGAAGHSSILD